MKSVWLDNPLKNIVNGIWNLTYLPMDEEKLEFEVLESRHGSLEHGSLLSSHL